VLIQATGHFTHFSPGATEVLISGCGLSPESIAIASETQVSFRVSVPLDAPTGTCEVTVVTTGPAHETVSATLTIDPGFTDATVPSEIPGQIDGSGPVRYGVVLTAGQVLRARVIRNPYTNLDPVLSVHGPGWNPAVPAVAESDDESAATLNARVIYQAPVGGLYFLEVRDRLGFNTGAYTLSLAWYEPEGSVEVGDAPPNPTGAPELDSRLLRGGFGEGDAIDVYTAAALPPVDRIAVQVIAQDLSPYATSGADVLLELLGDATSLGALATGTEGLDPVLYVSTGELAFIRLTSEGLSRTTYWLNVRPAIVINELQHDEATGWVGGFVELFGESGASLESCGLEGQAHDGMAASEVFAIDLTGQTLGPAGYFVLAHDDLVPGAGEGTVFPGLAITDPTTPYGTIGIALRCAGVIQDAVCYRGTDLPICGATAAPDTEAAIGRGFHIDTDDDAADFLPQLEPSPWARNLTEVR
jgi:hypothetical protein